MLWCCCSGSNWGYAPCCSLVPEGHEAFHPGPCGPPPCGHDGGLGEWGSWWKSDLNEVVKKAFWDVERQHRVITGASWLRYMNRSGQDRVWRTWRKRPVGRTANNNGQNTLLMFMSMEIYGWTSKENMRPNYTTDFCKDEWVLTIALKYLFREVKDGKTPLYLHDLDHTHSQKTKGKPDRLQHWCFLRHKCFFFKGRGRRGRGAGALKEHPAVWGHPGFTFIITLTKKDVFKSPSLPSRSRTSQLKALIPTLPLETMGVPLESAALRSDGEQISGTFSR